ncbi:MAG TPA: redoxin domain-containing protein [Candidatus Baltobacteraceae bacterium]
MHRSAHAAFAVALVLLLTTPLAAQTPPPAATPSATPAPAATSQALTGPQVGLPAPAFSLLTLDGEKASLAAYQGKTLVINVWATWCPPCRQEMGDLIAAYHKLGSEQVAFLGIDSSEEAPIVRTFVAAKGLPYPQAIDSEKTFENAYDIAYFPTTLVIDPHGVLRARYIDVISPPLLAQFIAAAAQGSDAVYESDLQRRIDRRLRDPSLVPAADATAIFAAAKRSAAAIDAAEDLLGSSDPSKGMTIDLLQTRTEEAAVRDRAIAALSAANRSDQGAALLLATLQGDAAANREAWRPACNAYRSALAVDPKNLVALDGLAQAQWRLEDYAGAIDTSARIAALQPDDVGSLMSLGLDYAKAGQFVDAYHTLDNAITLALAHVRTHPHAAQAIRQLAWAHLYAGRVHAQGADPAVARQEFAAVQTWALKLPVGDDRRDMYIEEAQEASVALDLTGVPQTRVSIAPWTGNVPVDIPATLRYRLIISGAPGAHVALRTDNVPAHWIASFCTDRLCAPFQVGIDLPAGGVFAMELQLVPDHPGMPAPRVVIQASDGRSAVSVSPTT